MSRKATTSDLKFLVWLDQEFYLTEIYPRRAGGFDVAGSKVPSAAKSFDTYEEANHWCALLRRRYPRTVVTDQRGAPVTAEQLKDLPPVKTYDLPRNVREVDLIPTEELRRRMSSDPVFRERVFNLWNGVVA